LVRSNARDVSLKTCHFLDGFSGIWLISKTLREFVLEFRSAKPGGMPPVHRLKNRVSLQFFLGNWLIFKHLG
jgi:hypothetical protein